MAWAKKTNKTVLLPARANAGSAKNYPGPSRFDFDALLDHGYCFRWIEDVVAQGGGASMYYRRINFREPLGLVRPSQQVDQQTTDFIAATFGDRPYTAVHMRSLEGSCPARAKKMAAALKEKPLWHPSRMCPVDVQWLTAQLSSAVLPRDVLICHDGQDPKRLAAAVESLSGAGLNVTVSTQSLFVDFWLLVRSALLMVNPCSTFSMDACIIKQQTRR